jgi:lambda family phage portal protein
VSFWSRLFTRAAPPPARAAGPPLEAAGGSNRWGGVPAPATDPAGSTILQRARHMAANHPACAAGVAAWSARCVGSGIVPNPAPPDAEIAALIADRWARWADRADLDRIGDFYALQDRVLRAVCIDGNVLVETIIDAGELRARARPIDALAVTLNRSLAGGYIDHGIERNSAGQIVAFHLYKDSLSFQTIRVPETQMIHVYRATVPGITFGTSWLAPVLLLARELDQLTDALLVQAKCAAMTMAYIVDTSQIGSVPYDGQQTGSLLNVSMEPGTTRILPSNYDVKFQNPAASNSAMELARLTLRQIASGLGVPAHLIDFDLAQVNYSSLRGSLLDFKRRVEQVQFFTMIPVLDQIYRKWLMLEIATGRIDIPNFQFDPDSWLKVSWLPPAFEFTDPLKDLQAEVLAINNGLKSRSQSVSERGYDINQLDLQIKQDRLREQQLDLTFGTSTNGTIDAAG